MNPLFDRFTAEPYTCAVCGRWPSGVGVTRSRGGGVAWICNRIECLPAGRDIVTMPNDELLRIEQEALADGGDAAGAFLDRIGKTDLATLHAEEWAEMLQLILTSYGESMRRRIDAGDTPF